MNKQPKDHTEGESLKADAIDLLAERRAVFVRRGQRALLTALLVTDIAAADGVRDAVELPPGIDPVCVGAVPGALARAGIIRADGYAKTCRPLAHARPVTVYGVDSGGPHGRRALARRSPRVAGPR